MISKLKNYFIGLFLGLISSSSAGKIECKLFFLDPLDKPSICTGNYVQCYWHNNFHFYANNGTEKPYTFHCENVPPNFKELLDHGVQDPIQHILNTKETPGVVDIETQVRFDCTSFKKSIAYRVTDLVNEKYRCSTDKGTYVIKAKEANNGRLIVVEDRRSDKGHMKMLESNAKVSEYLKFKIIENGKINKDLTLKLESAIQKAHEEFQFFAQNTDKGIGYMSVNSSGDCILLRHIVGKHICFDYNRQTDEFDMKLCEIKKLSDPSILKSIPLDNFFKNF